MRNCWVGDDDDFFPSSARRSFSSRKKLKRSAVRRVRREPTPKDVRERNKNRRQPTAVLEYSRPLRETAWEQCLFVALRSCCRVDSNAVPKLLASTIITASRQRRRRRRRRLGYSCRRQTFHLNDSPKRVLDRFAVHYGYLSLTGCASDLNKRLFIFPSILSKNREKEEKKKGQSAPVRNGWKKRNAKWVRYGQPVRRIGRDHIGFVSAIDWIEPGVSGVVGGASGSLASSGRRRHDTTSCRL